MKRSKPLRRKSALKKGKRLAAYSPKKKAWKKRYEESLAKDSPLQRDASTGVPSFKERLEPHHPYGRKGKYMLIYCYINSSFHRWIHDHGTEARMRGWLQPKFDERPLDPNVPLPWKPGTLINERYLTEEP